MTYIHHERVPMVPIVPSNIRTQIVGGLWRHKITMLFDLKDPAGPPQRASKTIHQNVIWKWIILRRHSWPPTFHERIIVKPLEASIKTNVKWDSIGVIVSIKRNFQKEPMDGNQIVGLFYFCWGVPLVLMELCSNYLYQWKH